MLSCLGADGMHESELDSCAWVFQPVTVRDVDETLVRASQPGWMDECRFTLLLRRAPDTKREEPA